MVARFMQRRPVAPPTRTPFRRPGPTQEDRFRSARDILANRGSFGGFNRGPINQGPTGGGINRPTFLSARDLLANRPGGGMSPNAGLPASNPFDRLAGIGGSANAGFGGPNGLPATDGSDSGFNRIRDAVRPAVQGLAGSLGGSMANDVLGNMHDIMQQAFDRSNQRQAAMMGLNNAIAPAPTSPAPPPPTPVERSPSVNPMFVPGAGGDQGGPVSPGLGGFSQPSQPAGGFERFSNAPLKPPPPWDSGANGATPPGSVGTQHGMPAYPTQGPVPMSIDVSPQQPPLTGMPHSMDQSGPGPLINGTMVPGASPMGGIPSPGLGGAVGQAPGVGMPHSMDQTGPNQASGTPTPPPGTAGAPVPSPGLGGVVGQGPAQIPTTSSPTSTPASTPQGSASPAIPNPRAGMPTFPATSAPSQPRSMPVPPWVYQQQNIQIPGNILAGNPNLANLAPGGQVDVSGAMGPIWGPINKGQLPGGLAGQMFQGTIDPRTGQPLGQGGGPVGQPAGAPGINAALVPGVGGAVPSPGLGGVPGGVNTNVLPGAGPGPSVAPAPPGAAPAPSGSGVVPGVQTPSALPGGVRSAREILAGRLGGANAPVTTPGVAAPAAPAPTTGAAPVPPGGAPAAAPAAAPVQPGAVGSSGIWDPQGQASPPVGGGSWDQINQYDPSIAKWTQQMGRPDLAPVIKGMIAVESGGQNISGGEPGSTGILQIMPQYWSDTAQQLGVDLNTPDGQIAVATAILAGQSGHGDQGSWQANFQSMFFPADDPSSGMSQASYTQWLQSMYDQGAQQGGTAPAGGPLDKTSVPPGSPADTGAPNTGSAGLPANPVDGTGQPRQSTGYPMPSVAQDPAGGSPMADGGESPQLVNAIEQGGSVISGFKDATDLPYYDYFNGHGGNAGEHPGIDIAPPAGTPQGAHLPVTTPVGGTIVCGGTGNGPGMDGSGCAAFNDVSYGGAGRVELQINDHESLIFGHMNTSAYQPGQQVQAGQAVGTMGGMNSDHTHVEARVWCGDGSYQIVDPSLMMAGYYDSYTC